MSAPSDAARSYSHSEALIQSGVRFDVVTDGTTVRYHMVSPVKIRVIGHAAGDVGQYAIVKSKSSNEEISISIDNPWLPGPKHIVRRKYGNDYDFWVYGGKVLSVECDYPVSDEEKEAWITRFVDRLKRASERLSGKGGGFQRRGIPEHVRHAVWRRDQGRCWRCGSRERLEFDHIIPVVEGGNDTERNIQLLCEPRNRKKGRDL